MGTLDYYQFLDRHLRGSPESSNATYFSSRLSHLKRTWFTRSRPLNDLAKYDNASRGPLGSIHLLWTFRGRDLISSIGATIIIAPIVLDPMAQQLIRHWNCPQPISGSNATVPRTNAYMEVGLHFGAGLSTIPVDLQAAVNGGVFVPSATMMSYDCPSGNCTFTRPFFTMGFTSECYNVSEELKFENVTRWYNYTVWEQNPNNSSNLTPQIITQNSTMLNASLPSGLSTSYNINAYGLTNYMLMMYNTSASNFEIIYGPRTMSPSPQTNLCPDQELNSTQSGLQDWAYTGYGAARCTVQPGVFSVKANVSSGKLRETTTLQTNDFAFVNAAQSTVDVTCLTAEQKIALANASYSLPQPNEPQWLPYNVSLYVDVNDTLVYQTATQNVSNATTRIVPPKCIYQFSSTSPMSLYNFFSTYFSGSIVPSGSQWTGSSVAQQLYNKSGITFESVNSMFRISHGQ